jgi:mercuric ion transport protein
MKFFNARNASLVSALATSACCLPTLALLVFSVGSATLSATFASYHWWFLAMGSALLATSYWMYFLEKKSCRVMSCAMPHPRLTRTSLIFGSLVVGAIAANSLTPLVERGLSNDATAGAIGGPTGQETITIAVDGMTCFSCELFVEKVLKGTPGVIDAEASTAGHRARITHDPARVSVADLMEAINTKTGYEARRP